MKEKSFDNKKMKNKYSSMRTVPVIACLMLLFLPMLISAGVDDRRSQGTMRDSIARKRVRPMIPDADRYQEGKMFLERADIWQYDEQTGPDVGEQYQVLSGNVVFRKNDMYMYCDSAHLYEQSNSVDAFGNVRMEQGDTLFVYADELNYDGATEIAVLYADPGKKVRLINRDVKLETDVFNYDMAEEVGYYNIGGVLTDKNNRLKSLEGEYHPNTKYAYFYFNVELESPRENDTVMMYTDSLEYNTGTGIARLVAATRIVNADGEILSTSGTYDTNSGLADLFERSTVVTSRGNTLTGDTLFYDRNKGYGEAFGNMIFVDSTRQTSLHGDYGYYNDVADSAFVTGRALVKEYSKGDTLYLHGDTVIAYVDKADTMRVTNVFHKVRFYRSDIQGLCDSLSSSERDSILYMYRHPVVWSDNRQIFGDVINVHLNDSTVDWARLPEFGFMAEHIDEDCYQQLTGNDMTVYFNDSTVRRMYVEGSVQLIIFPMESDSTYNKFAYVESSYMDSYFAKNTIESIHFWPETTTNITPLYLAKKKSYFLPKFAWYEDMRPMSAEDVFTIPESMVKLMRTASAKPIRKPAKVQNKPLLPEKNDAGTPVSVLPVGEAAPADAEKTETGAAVEKKEGDDSTTKESEETKEAEESEKSDESKTKESETEESKSTTETETEESDE